MPDSFDMQVLSLRPAMRRVSRMGVAHDAFRSDAVKGLQVTRNLLEYIEAARAVHFTDVRRDHHTSVPTQGDCAFHMTANREQGLRLWPWDCQFAWRAAAPDSKRAHLSGDASIHGIVSRADDRSVVLQKSIRYRP